MCFIKPNSVPYVSAEGRISFISLSFIDRVEWKVIRLVVDPFLTSPLKSPAIVRWFLRHPFFCWPSSFPRDFKTGTLPLFQSHRFTIFDNLIKQVTHTWTFVHFPLLQCLLTVGFDPCAVCNQKADAMLSGLLYGCATWSFSGEIVQRLSVFDSWCFHAVFTIGWNSCMCNVNGRKSFEL